MDTLQAGTSLTTATHKNNDTQFRRLDGGDSEESLHACGACRILRSMLRYRSVPRGSLAEPGTLRIGPNDIDPDSA